MCLKRGVVIGQLAQLYQETGCMLLAVEILISLLLVRNGAGWETLNT